MIYAEKTGESTELIKQLEITIVLAFVFFLRTTKTSYQLAVRNVQILGVSLSYAAQNGIFLVIKQ
jgi:hypothetical protein